MTVHRTLIALTCAFAAGVASASAAPATTCKTSRTFDDSGFHIRMSVSNEGGTCSAPTNFTTPGGNHLMGTSGSISSAPSHGAATEVFTPTSSSVEYTPTSGYTGTDHFEMRVLPSSRLWSVEVKVGP